jgi:signal transduction histidine kinase
VCVTKPVDRQELMVRVRNLLTQRQHKMDLHRANVGHVELHRFKDEMSSMIVHDLKNPIAAVLSNIDYVLEVPGELDPSQLEALVDAQVASQRAIRLISNLLDVAGIEENRFKLRRSPTHIAPLVAHLVKHRATLARVRGIEVSSAIDPELWVDLDGELVGRAIENILDNAFRYTPTHGRVAVFGEVIGANAELRIANSGSSVPEELRPLIFEKFGQRANDAGRMNLGLGLYFCKLAVEAHGGRIWVDESPAFPTVFNLRFPINACRSPADSTKRLE